jgi:hypothetical protein
MRVCAHLLLRGEGLSPALWVVLHIFFFSRPFILTGSLTFWIFEKAISPAELWFSF